MIRKCFLGVILCPLVFINPVSASEINSEKPKIGLVLSGGGAKGGAHLGVIRRLEELEIPIDFVSGTSMGSYFAALLAMGYDADEIESITENIDWSSAFSDQAGRSIMPAVRKKHIEDYPIETIFGYDSEGVNLAKAVVQGQTMAALLRESIGYLPQLSSFDDLPIPYRAVATDLSNMTDVTLSSGDLAQAMQASMTVPGALRPVVINNKTLIDGGIVNNVPIEQVKNMGADLVIAVDVGSKLKPANELPSAVHLLDQLSNELLRAGTEDQFALLTTDDIVITPDLKGVSSLDFDQLSLAAEYGYQAALTVLQPEVIDGFSGRDYQEYRNELDKRQQILFESLDNRVNDLVLNNKSDWSDEVILSQLNIQLADDFSPSQLEEGIEMLYAHNTFSRINYTRYQDKDDQYTLAVEVEPKSWGPNYIDFQFNLQDTGKNNPQSTIGIATTTKPINSLGGLWRNELTIGTEREISTSFNTPITKDGRYFTNVALTAGTYLDHYYPSPYSNEFEHFNYSTVGMSWDVGIELNRFANFRLNLLALHQNVDLQGEGVSTEESILQPNLVYEFDSLDSLSFPTDGGQFEAQLGAQYSYLTEVIDPIWDVNWNTGLLGGSHNLRFVGEVGGTEAERLSTLNLQRLGGLGRMSGFQPDHLNARYKAFAGLVYYHQLAKPQLGSYSLPMYIGGSVEYGGLWFDKGGPYSQYDFVSGAGSVFAAIDVNQRWPLVIAYGANGLNQTLYLQIGRPF